MTILREHTGHRGWHLVTIVVHLLAIATVQSHAGKCSAEFPDASREVLSNMYIDDCHRGANHVEATVKLQQSLDKMMERGRFNLTKWTDR